MIIEVTSGCNEFKTLTQPKDNFSEISLESFEQTEEKKEDNTGIEVKSFICQDVSSLQMW